MHRGTDLTVPLMTTGTEMSQVYSLCPSKCDSPAGSLVHYMSLPKVDARSGLLAYPAILQRAQLLIPVVRRTETCPAVNTGQVIRRKDCGLARRDFSRRSYVRPTIVPGLKALQ
jgi:hypothetical protein